MDEENAVTPYDTRNEVRSLFNNPKWSDVRFLVDGQTVYGHKFVLRMGSPVFESMFFGDLKENQDEIEIKDLSPVGFMNALRYIYGFEIDFELADLYESYLAADKYLLHGFSKAFFDYIQSKSNSESVCLIYEQLIKIGEREEILLACVKTVIIENSLEVFESEHFTQIDQETLISLLSLEELLIPEIDLLAAVSKWVNCEVQRQDLPVNSENRRRVFESIKGYILFTALTPEKIASCRELAELLSDEERGLLLLHLLDKANPLRMELKTPRRAFSGVCSVFVDDARHLGLLIFSETTGITANRRVSIQTIHTTYSGSAQSVCLKILNSDDVDLGLKIERLIQDGRLCFSFEPRFVVEPNRVYKLKVSGTGAMTAEDHLSKQYKLKKGSVIFNITCSNTSKTHCVKGFSFYL